MSYDYRALLSNLVVQISFLQFHIILQQYGQAASDNLIVAVAGTDVAPDLAIGRLSIETVS